MLNMDKALRKMGFELTTPTTDETNACLPLEVTAATITDKSGCHTISVIYGVSRGAVSARITKINGTSKWYCEKTEGQLLAIIRQCMAGYVFQEPTANPTAEPTADAEENKEEETMTHTEAIEAINARQNAENLFTNVTEADVEAEMKKEEETMETAFTTIQEAIRMIGYNKKHTAQIGGKNYEFFKLDSDGYIYVLCTGSNRATRYNGEGLNGKRISVDSFIKAEYELEHKPVDVDPNDPENAYPTEEQTAEDAQAELDKDPCFVDPMADLQKPAVLDEFGCVDCSECHVKPCVHRDCMRRNPRSKGGLAECPRLSVKAEEEESKDPELEQIKEEIPGIEDAEAELERNIQQGKLDAAMEKLGYTRIDSEWNDIRYTTNAHEVMAWNTVKEGLAWVKAQVTGKKEKKASKPRRPKDIAYEDNGVTLTTKQVDFLLALKQTDQWEGLESKLYTDLICDEIEGQFAGKPMTVGAMISTLCEKGLAERFKGQFTDPVTGRTRKSTYMELTIKGREVARELGLA